VAGFEPERFIAHALDQVVARLAVELLKKQLDEETDPDAMDGCPVCETLLRNLVGQGRGGYRVHVTLEQPVIGLGAPVHYFLPKAAELLGAEATVPPHADVANAIGAITSWVAVSKQVQIDPSAAGGYAVLGLPNAREFARFDDAHAFAVAELERLVRAQALAAGTSDGRVRTRVDDRIARAADGSEIFLGRVITASVAGPPDLARRGK